MFERRYDIINEMDHNNIKGFKVHCALGQLHMVPTQRIVTMSRYSDGAKFKHQTIEEQAFSVRLLLDCVTSPSLRKLTLLFILPERSCLTVGGGLSSVTRNHKQLWWASSMRYIEQ